MGEAKEDAAVQALAQQLRARSAELNAARTLPEPAPASHLPVLGPFFVLLRRLANRLATRWYVAPLSEQPQRFNAVVTAAFEEYAALLVMQEQRLAEQETRLAAAEQRSHPAERGPGDTVPEAVGGPALPETQSAREQRFWDDCAAASLLAAKEVILPRLPDEDEESFLRRFDLNGAEEALALHPYHNARSRVLELGCGIGRILRHIRAAERWGVDISDRMLDWARLYLQGEEGIHLVKSDGSDLQGVPSSYFDLAYSLYVLQHTNKRSGLRLLRDLYRVLRPEGQLCLQVLNIACPEGMADLERVLLNDYPLDFYTEEELCYKLAYIGFESEHLHAHAQYFFVVARKPRPAGAAAGVPQDPEEAPPDDPTA
jgi:SAM-dependent methyltransferase